jgi:CRISPR-associated protein Cas1
MGQEGAAAAAYFAAFASAFPPALGFSRRNRRPPRDPVNVCLSIGYVMLHFEARQAAAREGFDPALGVFHDVRPGRDSLVCDLVEPLRAAVDGFVHDLFADGVLRAENFTTSEDACMLAKQGRTLFYRAFEERAAAAVREGVAAEAAALAAAIRARVRANAPAPLALPAPPRPGEAKHAPAPRREPA